MTKNATIIVNLGTPSELSLKEVKKYLKEFLMDEYVVDLPYILRKILVCGIIIPFRAKKSFHAYQSIWQNNKSPLLLNSEKLLAGIKKITNATVELAMRYGEPSLEKTIVNLLQNNQIDVLKIIPLYPQFADSTFTTVASKVKQIIEKHQFEVKLEFLSPFYANEEYLEILSKTIEPYIDSCDHILFSNHGLPERHIKKCDKIGNFCLANPNCCQSPSPALEFCYRAQSYFIARDMAQKLTIPSDKYTVAFQSRLGKAKWIEPYTEEEIIALAKKQCKKLAVVCPSFVADCLETLEEIQLRAKELFIAHGGEDLKLIPCLNDNEEWIKLVAKWCE